MEQTGILSLTELRTLVNEAIAALPLAGKQPAALYEPMAYLLKQGGKRARPVLALAMYQAFSDGPARTALPVALALELFHNFTLAHDDIMDNAPDRRGKPTVHVVWDESTAILAGDALFAYTVELLAECRVSSPRLMADYARVAMEVCEGQAMDLAQAGANEVQIDDYLEMIGKKTAALLGGSMRIGAIAGGADDESLERLNAYGRNIGLAFQLQDDLLDLYANKALFGKRIGGDILEQKKNYLWLTALKNADAADAELLRSWAPDAKNDDERVAAIKAVYDRRGAYQTARSAIEDYYAQAEDHISPLLNNPGVRLAHDYMRQMMHRDN